MTNANIAPIKVTMNPNRRKFRLLQIKMQKMSHFLKHEKTLTIATFATFCDSGKICTIGRPISRAYLRKVITDNNYLRNFVSMLKHYLELTGIWFLVADFIVSKENVSV